MIMDLINKIDNYEKVKIEILYNEGGINYFDYKNQERGYYLHFNPCNIKDYGNGFTGIQTEPFHKRSWKMLICPVKRRSEKKLIELNQLLITHQNDILREYNEDNESAYLYCRELFGDYLNGNREKAN